MGKLIQPHQKIQIPLGDQFKVLPFLLHSFRSKYQIHCISDIPAVVILKSEYFNDFSENIDSSAKSQCFAFVHLNLFFVTQC